MPKSVTGGVDPSSLKPTKRKRRPGPSAEELRQKSEDKIFEVRNRYDLWARRLFEGLWEYEHLRLVQPADDYEDGVFEPDDLALVPTRDLENYRMCFDEGIETLEILRDDLDAVLEARDAAGK